MANLVRRGCDLAILPSAAQCVLARTPDVGGSRCGLSFDQHRPPRIIGMPGGDDREAAFASGRVVSRFCFCAAPAECGGGGLDLGAEEHTVRGLLPGVPARVSAL